MSANSARPKTATVTRRRSVRTYAELWRASKFVLDAGRREPIGSSWQFMSSAVLTAFVFEAYVNHVGETLLSSWSQLERLPPLAKLDLLCEVLKVSLPTDQRPRQTLTKLF